MTKIDRRGTCGDDVRILERVLMGETVRDTDLTFRRAGLLLWRALRLRCPNCGGKPLFASFGKLRKRCPECGLWLERGEGDYYLGAYMVSLIAIETLFAVGFVAALLITWPDPPWDAIQYVGAAVLTAGVIICYPLSKTVWLAVDLMFRPVTLDDLSADGPIDTHGPMG
jgi:uncharacterized protein (DUF983 family)